MVIVPRGELAPRRLFKRREDWAILEWSELEPLLAGFERSDEPLPHYDLAWDETPREILALLTAQLSFEGRLQGLDPDQVLNAEDVAPAAER